MDDLKSQVVKITKDWFKNQGFHARKLTDTPTDALQVTPKKYVDAKIASVVSLIPPLPISIANGGTGASVLSAGYLKSNGSVVSVQAVPIPVADGGTGGTNRTTAFNNLAPSASKGDFAIFDGSNWVDFPIGTDGQVLTANSTVSLGADYEIPFTCKFSTIFETIGRFVTSIGGGGAITFGQDGAALTLAGGSAMFARLQVKVQNNTNFSIYSHDGIWSCELDPSGFSSGGTCDAFAGVGQVSVTVTGHTFTNKHIGFKLIETSISHYDVYATCADGTTETATKMITGGTDNDSLELIFKIISSTKVNFYIRQNAGNLSAPTVITTNIPTTAESFMQLSISNDNTNTTNTLNVAAMTFER